MGTSTRSSKPDLPPAATDPVHGRICTNPACKDLLTNSGCASQHRHREPAVCLNCHLTVLPPTFSSLFSFVIFNSEN